MGCGCYFGNVGAVHFHTTHLGPKIRDLGNRACDCERLYLLNGCDDPRPALSQLCRQWMLCADSPWWISLFLTGALRWLVEILVTAAQALPTSAYIVLVFCLLIVTKLHYISN